MSHVFNACLKKVGNTFAVEVPEEISRYFGKKGYVPIIGTVNMIEIKTNLIPKGNSKHIIYINSFIRKQLQLQEDDELFFKIDLHKEYYNYPLPEDFKQALNAIPEVSEMFHKQNNSLKFWMIEYINSAKKIETRENRIIKAIDILIRRNKK